MIVIYSIFLIILTLWIYPHLRRKLRRLYRRWRYPWISIERVPRWVWKKYLQQPWHDGLSYIFSGKHYQYKIISSDRGYGTFYKRKKWRRS